MGFLKFISKYIYICFNKKCFSNPSLQYFSKIDTPEIDVYLIVLSTWETFAFHSRDYDDDSDNEDISDDHKHS